MADLKKLQLERQELKRRVSALENEAQKARNAASDANKARIEAENENARIPGLEDIIDGQASKIASLEASVAALKANEHRAESIIEDVRALARLVARA